MSQYEAFRSHLSVLRHDLDIAVGIWMASEKYLPAKGEGNRKVVNWVWALQLVSYFSFQVFPGQPILGLRTAVCWPPAACHILDMGSLV